MKTIVKSKAQSIIEHLLSFAGVQINGPNPWDIRVHNEELYDRVLREADLGLGESYMDGWWDCERVDMLIDKILRARLQDKIKASPKLMFLALKHALFNMQTRKGAKRVAVEHYDIGNSLYQQMLDKEMSYSCGYWAKAKCLDEAQEDKLELLCQKMDLRPGEKLLDIGCGWGAMARHAAKHHGAKVVGITISKEQKKLAEERSRGLPIEYRLMDYRDLNEQFDKIVSIGMFEHVGQKNYATYMKTAHKCLREGGMFLLHTIGSNQSSKMGNPWLEKYIFPNGMLPSIKQIATAAEGLFVMEDWHNFGPDYDKTLLAWHANFNNSWEMFKDNYTERFKRMWNYYLLTCAACFRSRHIQLWQIALSKNGLPTCFKARELKK